MKNPIILTKTKNTDGKKIAIGAEDIFRIVDEGEFRMVYTRVRGMQIAVQDKLTDIVRECSKS